MNTIPNAVFYNAKGDIIAKAAIDTTDITTDGAAYSQKTSTIKVAIKWALKYDDGRIEQKTVNYNNPLVSRGNMQLAPQFAYADTALGPQIYFTLQPFIAFQIDGDVYKCTPKFATANYSTRANWTHTLTDGTVLNYAWNSAAYSATLTSSNSADVSLDFSGAVKTGAPLTTPYYTLCRKEGERYRLLCGFNDIGDTQTISVYDYTKQAEWKTEHISGDINAKTQSVYAASGIKGCYIWEQMYGAPKWFFRLLGSGSGFAPGCQIVCPESGFAASASGVAPYAHYEYCRKTFPDAEWKPDVTQFIKTMGSFGGATYFSKDRFKPYGSFSYNGLNSRLYLQGDIDEGDYKEPQWEFSKGVLLDKNTGTYWNAVPMECFSIADRNMLWARWCKSDDNNPNSPNSSFFYHDCLCPHNCFIFNTVKDTKSLTDTSPPEGQYLCFSQKADSVCFELFGTTGANKAYGRVSRPAIQFAVQPDLSGWETRFYKDFTRMFKNTNFTGNIRGWDTTSATEWTDIFNGCPIPSENMPPRLR